MKQASRINRIKFPIVPTSKRFILAIGFNGITSLLYYRLLIRFLFLNEKHVRQSRCRLPLLSLGFLLSTEQYVTPPHSQRGAWWKCGNLCNSKLNIRCRFSRRAISTSVGRVHLLRLQPHYKGLMTQVASHKVTVNSKLIVDREWFEVTTKCTRFCCAINIVNAETGVVKQDFPYRFKHGALIMTFCFIMLNQIVRIYSAPVFRKNIKSNYT
jgi:hypothetical protein